MGQTDSFPLYKRTSDLECSFLNYFGDLFQWQKPVTLLLALNPVVLADLLFNSETTKPTTPPQETSDNGCRLLLSLKSNFTELLLALEQLSICCLYSYSSSSLVFLENNAQGQLMKRFRAGQCAQNKCLVISPKWDI